MGPSEVAVMSRPIPKHVVAKTDNFPAQPALKARTAAIIKAFDGSTGPSPPPPHRNSLDPTNLRLPSALQKQRGRSQGAKKAVSFAAPGREVTKIWVQSPEEVVAPPHPKVPSLRIPQQSPSAVQRQFTPHPVTEAGSPRPLAPPRSASPRAPQRTESPASGSTVGSQSSPSPSPRPTRRPSQDLKPMPAPSGQLLVPPAQPQVVVSPKKAPVGFTFDELLQMTHANRKTASPSPSPQAIAPQAVPPERTTTPPKVVSPRPAEKTAEKTVEKTVEVAIEEVQGATEVDFLSAMGNHMRLTFTADGGVVYSVEGKRRTPPTTLAYRPKARRLEFPDTTNKSTVLKREGLLRVLGALKGFCRVAGITHDIPDTLTVNATDLEKLKSTDGLPAAAPKPASIPANPTAPVAGCLACATVGRRCKYCLADAAEAATPEGEMETVQVRVEKVGEVPRNAKIKVAKVGELDMGVVATAAIAKGELVVVEPPLLESPYWTSKPCCDKYLPGAPSCDHTRQHEKHLEVQFKALPQSQQKVVMGLASIPDSKHAKPTVASIFYTNGLSTEGSTRLFPVLARVNHSCNPNVYHSWQDGAERLYALHDIPPGEQLLMSYRPEAAGASTTEERAAALEFKCKCKVCTLPAAERRASDARRVKWRELKEGVQARFTSNPKEALAMVDELIAVITKETNNASDLASACHDGCKIALVAGEYDRAIAYAQQEYRHWVVARGASDRVAVAARERASQLGMHV